MHKTERGINDYVRYALEKDVQKHINLSRRENRRWYYLFAFVLALILGVMFYIGIIVDKWNRIWEQKIQTDRELREQYLKDRQGWLNDTLENRNGKK